MWQSKREKLRFENMQNFDEISISQTERVPIEMLRIDLENQYHDVSKMSLRKRSFYGRQNHTRTPEKLGYVAH